MHNVTHTVEGNELVIRVPLTPAAINGAPPSSTGKTRLVGSSSGYIGVAAPNVKGAIAFSVTVTVKG